MTKHLLWAAAPFVFAASAFSQAVNPGGGGNGTGGGATIPATTSVLKGDGAGNGAAATAGTDYVIPSGSITGTASNITGTLPGSQVGPGVSASNVTTGTLPVAQTAAIIGDVAKAAGSSAATVTAVNGGAIPTTAGPLITTSAGKFAGVQNLMRYQGFGDSYNRGLGATSLGRSHLNLLANDVVSRVPWQNNAVGGTTAPQIALQVYANWISDPVLPSLAMFNGGNNDYTQDTCTKTAGTTGTLCQINYTEAMNAAISWVTIPNANKIFPTAATQSGGGVWTNDPAVYINAQSGIGNAIIDSNAVYNNVSGSTLTFNVPANNRGVIGTTQWTRNGFTGTYTISIDGTLQTNPCTNTTTFNSGPCGGQAMVYANANGLGANLSVPQRNRFAVTAGVAHTVVITNTSSQYLEFHYVDYMPTTLPANTNFAVVDNSSATFDINGNYSAAAQALVAQLASDGQQVVLADVRTALAALPSNGTATAATNTCVATTYTGHPNDCAYRAMYNTERTALGTFTATLATNNVGGQQPSNSGDMYGQFRYFAPLNAFGFTPYGMLAQFNPGLMAYGPGLSIIDNGSQLIGMNAAYGSLANGTSNNLFNIFSTYPFTCLSSVSSYAMDQNGMVSGVRRWCHDNNTGNTVQLGTASAPQFITTGSAPTVANGAAAGTSPGTPTITGTNMDHVVSVVTGTATTANAVLATITFNGTLGTAPRGCSMTQRDSGGAANLTTVYTTAPSTTTYTISTGSVAPAVSTTMTWYMQCR